MLLEARSKVYMLDGKRLTISDSYIKHSLCKTLKITSIGEDEMQPLEWQCKKLKLFIKAW